MMSEQMRLAERIGAAGPWWQRFVFPNGQVVGQWDSFGLANALLGHLNIKGKTFLDIGCMAGACTLFAEWQGAICTGIEVHPRSREQAAIVKEVFKAEFIVEDTSVYDIGPAYLSDVVLMSGVYYHLQDPVLGIRKAWDVTKGTLCLEGEVLAGEKGSYARFYKGEYKGDGTNWWVPTVECFTDWVETVVGDEGIVDIHYPFRANPNRVAATIWRKQ